VTNHIPHKQINIALRNKWPHLTLGYRKPRVIDSWPTIKDRLTALTFGF